MTHGRPRRREINNKSTTHEHMKNKPIQNEQPRQAPVSIFDALRQPSRELADLILFLRRCLDDAEEPGHRSMLTILCGIARGQGHTPQYALRHRAELFNGNLPFLLFAWPFTNYRHLTHPWVIAAMYRTWRQDAAGSWEFWKLVAHESHADNLHATRVLARFLRLELFDPKGHPRPTRNRREMARRCQEAWDDYRSEQLFWWQGGQR